MEDTLRHGMIVLAILLGLCMLVMNLMFIRYMQLTRRMKRIRDSLVELFYASKLEHRDHPKILSDAREHARKCLRMETKDPENVPDLNRVVE